MFSNASLQYTPDYTPQERSLPHEKNVPTQQYQQKENPRLSRPDGHEKRTSRHQAAAGQRPETAFGTDCQQVAG
jgi:hypothetical protein